jgi:hypothetical protein
VNPPLVAADSSTITEDQRRRRRGIKSVKKREENTDLFSVQTLTRRICRFLEDLSIRISD